MRKVAKALVVLAALAAAGWLGWTQLVRPALPGGVPEAAPALPAQPPLDAALAAELAALPDGDAAERIREVLSRGLGARAEAEARALLDARAAAAAGRAVVEVEELLFRHRYQAAADRAEDVRRRWRGTKAEARMSEMLAELREEQRQQVEARAVEARELADEGRTEAAREALRTGWELEAEFRSELSRRAEELEGLLRARSSSSPGGPPLPTGPAAVTAKAGEPPAPPALPGFPHPDVKRRAEAEAQLTEAREAFAARRYQPAAEGLDKLIGYFGDLAYVKRRREGVEAMRMLARHKAKGVLGLFHAAAITREGSRLRLRYDFTDEDQERDWEEMATIPIKDDGSFQPVRGGVRGTGAMTYLHKGFFRNDTTIRCESVPHTLRSHGVALCQQGLETRQVMLLVTNHWFVEGENYVKPRPGHSVLMFGKGTNADVPIDSPDIGFIFRGPSYTRPSPNPGDTLDLTFTVNGRQMTGEVAMGNDRARFRQPAYGDDDRGIERLRPALFVLQADVIFREIRIEGTLHPDFERTRVAELLARVEALD